jgi:hypothetical protein
MDKPYRIDVFGKTGCDKCKVLQGRLDGLLAAPSWQDFEKVYHDVETEDGLVEFCWTGCINPQRIPAFTVSRRNPDTGSYEPVPDRRPPSLDATRLYVQMGLQTDYADAHKGVTTPTMITAVLDASRTTASA